MGSVKDATLLHHMCIILLLIWFLNSFNCCHPVAYCLSLVYLYFVHEKYVIRLRKKLKFEATLESNHLRVFSDSETVRWLNHAVEKIWPVCLEEIVSQKILLPMVPWFLHKYKPWTVKDAEIQHLYLGSSPPVFTKMRVLQQSNDTDDLVLELGMDFLSAADMSAILGVKLRKLLGFGMWARSHLSDMRIEGNVLVGFKFLPYWPFIGRLHVCFAGPPYFQMTVKPIFTHGLDVSEFPGIAGWIVLVGFKFLPYWPFIGRLHVCFAGPPYFQMTVKPIFTHGLDVSEFPGIAGWIDNLMALVFEQTLVEPNMLVVDVDKFCLPRPENWFSVDAKEPIAQATVEILEAADMKPADLNGLADPFVRGRLGPYRFRTKTRKKTLAPKWHEEFKIPICTWESPNILIIEVLDKDLFYNDTMGDCCVSINEIRDGQRHEMWLPLKNDNMGRLRLAVTVSECNKKRAECSCDLELPDGESSFAKKCSSVTSSDNFPKVDNEFEAMANKRKQRNPFRIHRHDNQASGESQNSVKKLVKSRGLIHPTKVWKLINHINASS